VASKRLLDRCPFGAVPELGDRFQHRQVGLAATVLLDTLPARDPDGCAGRPTEFAERDLDQRGLADPGLPGDEPELPPSTGRFAQPRGDLGALVLASDHETIRPRIAVDIEGRGRD
jgi:hypothetical protein